MGQNNADPYRLTENPCWPSTLSPEAGPGFALINNDGYYINNREFFLRDAYTKTPDAFVTGE